MSLKKTLSALILGASMAMPSVTSARDGILEANKKALIQEAWDRTLQIKDEDVRASWQGELALLWDTDATRDSISQDTLENKLNSVSSKFDPEWRGVKIQNLFDKGKSNDCYRREELEAAQGTLYNLLYTGSSDNFKTLDKAFKQARWNLVERREAILIQYSDMESILQRKKEKLSSNDYLMLRGKLVMSKSTHICSEFLIDVLNAHDEFTKSIKDAVKSHAVERYIAGEEFYSRSKKKIAVAREFLKPKVIDVDDGTKVIQFSVDYYDDFGRHTLNECRYDKIRYSEKSESWKKVDSAKENCGILMKSLRALFK